MIAVLNIALPVLVALVLFFTWKFKNWKLLFLIPVLIWGHGVFQPTYFYKGTVAKAPFVEPQMSDKPLVDRLSKPVDSSTRDAQRAKEIEQTDAMVEKLLSHKKEN